MEIIGAGFGRTWTMSLRAALEELGYGPCYHFREVILHPGHIATWQRAADGQPVDWRTSFLKDYRAVLDYPAVSFLDDIRAAFPEAKVILTDRDPDIRVRDRPVRFEGQVLFSDPAPGRDPARWYHNALLAALVLNILPPWRGFYKMLQSSNLGRVFHGRFEDRARAIAVYQKHMAQLIASLPAEQLLVFEVKQGWEPLCAFLGAPVPDKPFPHINDRQKTKRASLFPRILTIGLALAVLYALYRLIF